MTLLPRLFVVLLFVDFLALLVELLVQVLALLARERAVGLVRVLQIADVTTLRAQLLRFVVRQLAGLHALHDAPGLVRLALVHARVADPDRRGVRTVLGVVLLPIDATRLLVRFVPQMSTFARGHDAISLGAIFHSNHVCLAGNEAAGLGARELATRHAVVNARALVVFALVNVVLGLIPFLVVRALRR